jgi:hypothetical protein
MKKIRKRMQRCFICKTLLTWHTLAAHLQRWKCDAVGTFPLTEDSRFLAQNNVHQRNRFAYKIITEWNFYFYTPRHHHQGSGGSFWVEIYILLQIIQLKDSHIHSEIMIGWSERSQRVMMLITIIIYLYQDCDALNNPVEWLCVIELQICSQSKV